MSLGLDALAVPSSEGLGGGLGSSAYGGGTYVQVLEETVRTWTSSLGLHISAALHMVAGAGAYIGSYEAVLTGADLGITGHASASVVADLMTAGHEAVVAATEAFARGLDVGEANLGAYLNVADTRISDQALYILGFRNQVEVRVEVLSDSSDVIVMSENSDPFVDKRDRDVVIEKYGSDIEVYQS